MKLSRRPYSREQAGLIRLVAFVCGVSEPTARRWVTGTTAPPTAAQLRAFEATVRTYVQHREAA